MINNQVITVVILGGLLASFPVLAANQKTQTPSQNQEMNWSHGWYIGGGINGNAENVIENQGTPDFLENYTNPPYPGNEFELSNYDVGFEVYIGRQINRHWSIELGYTWVPVITFDNENEPGDEEIADLKINQWNVHIVTLGYLPIAQYLDGFMKIGAGYFGSNQELDIGEVNLVTDELRTYALTYGLGLEFTWEHWGLRGEYTVVSPLSHDSHDFYIADLISASLYYKFD